MHRDVYAVGHGRPEPAQVIGWPAVLAYGEARAQPSQLPRRSGGSAAARPRRRDGTDRAARARRAGSVCDRVGGSLAGDGDPRSRTPSPARSSTWPNRRLRPARAAWEEADRLKLLRLAERRAVCERGCEPARPEPIRRLLAELAQDDRDALAARGPLRRLLPRVTASRRAATNVDVLGHEVDALWPAARLIVELDSWEFHSHRAAFERDRARDADSLLAGYRTIRVTHRRLDRRSRRAGRRQIRRSGSPGPRRSRSQTPRSRAASRRRSRAVSVGLSPTRTPFASSASFFAWAVPEEPEMIAPAWPICLPGGRGEAGDVGDDRLGDLGGDELGGALLGVAADLADHHDQLGLGVGLVELEDVDEVGADDRVAADADDRGVALARPASARCRSGRSACPTWRRRRSCRGRRTGRG